MKDCTQKIVNKNGKLTKLLTCIKKILLENYWTNNSGMTLIIKYISNLMVTSWNIGLCVQGCGHPYKRLIVPTRIFTLARFLTGLCQNEDFLPKDSVVI